MTEQKYETKTENEGQSKSLSEKMRGFASKRNLMLAGALGSMVYFGGFTTYIDKNEQGVKQNTFSPFGLLGQQGISDTSYETGRAFVIPFVQTMHKFPKEEQALHLHKDSDDARHRKYSGCINAARIQTSDGFYVDIDATVLYKIVDPHLLIKTLGAGKLYETAGLIPRTEPALRDTMGKLNPEDFYNPQKRIEIQQEAQKRLDEVLSKNGIKINHIMIRDVRYHPDIENKLEARKVQDQLVQTRTAQKEEAEQQAILDKIVQEGKAIVDVRNSEATAYVQSKKAEQDSYDRIKRSQGDRLVALAEAQKTSMVNSAYTGAGSDRLVALKFAEVMKGLDRIVIQAGGKEGVNPLDIESTISLLEGKVKPQ